MNNEINLAPWFERLKADIDLHELAERLGLERPEGGKGNYRSPAHKDKHPSLSIFNGGRAWKDHSDPDCRGSAIDLVLYCRADVQSPLDAAKLLGEWYGIPMPRNDEPRREKTMVEYIAERCRGNDDAAVDYLIGRGITEEVAKRVTKSGAVGWNTWTSSKVVAGQPGHGGAGVAFVVKTLNPGRVVAVDVRYADAELNGGVKTQCQGEKDGYGWTSDIARLRRAHTVYFVESAINALSIESCNLPHGTAAFALRGTGNADNIDLSWMRGKTAIIALDHADAVNERTSKRPGLAAAWRLSERLTMIDVANHFVDMQDWEDGEDVNDVLVDGGRDELLRRLKQLEAWLIPGMPGGGDTSGRQRVFLPGHDWHVYWRFRVKSDFTQYVAEKKEDADGNVSESFEDLCAFRIAGISRVRVQSHLSTINGVADAQPETVFGISAQLARHGARLQREVVTDDKLYNVEWWKGRFGFIWKPAQFARMINVLERSADIGARDVVNFVGLAWRDGKLAALEGSDTYFTEPVRQCLYYNLAFPRGSAETARTVIRAYQDTFHQNAAAITLVWALGAHLKCVFGFYPHFQMQAEKGSGKSKLLDSLQTTLSFQVLSGQMLKTDHRRRASVSWTSQPVGWDEYSKLPKTVLGDIDSLLQSTYRFEFTRVGAQLVPYLMCAPVLLAGEEVDVQSLQSKICRSTLSVKKQGPVLPRDLPQFPVWAWMQWLTTVDIAHIRAQQRKAFDWLTTKCRASTSDATARRMLENYSLLATAWGLLAEFAGIDARHGNFLDDLVAEMNMHLVDTDGQRLPWVWIMEILLSELDANRYEHPFCWERVTRNDGTDDVALFIRPNHVMDHVSTAQHLRAKYDSLSIKTGSGFKRQLHEAPEVVLYTDAERTVRGHRVAHLTGISLKQLERLGLYATPKFN